MKKHTVLSLLIVSSCTIIYAQQEVVENSQSMVVMSEADIVSLTNTLRKYKKDRVVDVTTDSISNIVLKNQDNTLKNNTYEFHYLKNQIEQLENQLNNFDDKQSNNVARVESSSNNLNERELKNLKYEINQLKFAIQQLSNKPNDNLVFVTPPQNQANNNFQQPKEVIISEQVPVNNNKDIILRQKLDSLNTLLKNMKQTDSPSYSADFDALQKRIDVIKNEMLTKNSAQSNYAILVSKYKGYNRDIYFANNSRILNIDASQAIEELFAILDSNDNLDIVVKGFASNKGNAIYNENLSMQRTEAVKRALMIRGIHPTRVLTQYHGIDYNAQNANEARRVEVSILVRK